MVVRGSVRKHVAFPKNRRCPQKRTAQTDGMAETPLSKRVVDDAAQAAERCHEPVVPRHERREVDAYRKAGVTLLDDNGTWFLRDVAPTFRR